MVDHWVLNCVEPRGMTGLKIPHGKTVRLHASMERLDLQVTPEVTYFGVPVSLLVFSELFIGGDPRGDRVSSDELELDSDVWGTYDRVVSNVGDDAEVQWMLDVSRAGLLEALWSALEQYQRKTKKTVMIPERSRLPMLRRCTITAEADSVALAIQIPPGIDLEVVKEEIRSPEFEMLSAVIADIFAENQDDAFGGYLHSDWAKDPVTGKVPDIHWRTLVVAPSLTVESVPLVQVAAWHVKFPGENVMAFTGAIQRALRFVARRLQLQDDCLLVTSILDGVDLDILTSVVRDHLLGYFREGETVVLVSFDQAIFELAKSLAETMFPTMGIELLPPRLL